MKTVIVLVGFLACFGATFGKSLSFEKEYVQQINLQQRIFENAINNTIRYLVGLLKPYDPASLDFIETNLLGYHALVENLRAEGFSNIYASHISLSGIITWTLEITINIPRVFTSVRRWLFEGSRLLWGDGTASLDVEDVSFGLSLDYSILSNSITDVTFTPHVGSAVALITGIRDDPKLSQCVTDWINKFLNDTLNNTWNLHEYIIKVIKAAIDWILGWIGK